MHPPTYFLNKLKTYAYSPASRILFFFIYLFFILRFGITAEQKGGETTTGKATKLLLAHSL